MRLSLLTCVLFLFINNLNAQDAYHQAILSQFFTDYNLENSSFVFNNTEQSNINDSFFYGSGNMSNSNVSDQVFTQQSSINVNSTGTNVWDSGWGITNKKTIQKDDIVCITFYAKGNSDVLNLFYFIEDNSTFDKEIYTEIDFEDNWNQYFITFQASKNYSIGTLTSGFHLAGAVQSFDIAGFTALNFGTQYELDEIPSDFGANKYGGYEEDAEWRAPAQLRIEEYRKADLNIVVKNQQGELVENATVFVDMTKHEFEFGTAVVACRFPGNKCFNQTYINKLFNLDNQGHGFNSFVTENALKWDGWEEEWIGTPAETKSAIKYLGDSGNEVRGHTLLWPGWQYMPDDMQVNQSNENYLKDRINSRLETMLEDEIISEYIKEWDILNEIAVNRDLEFAMENFADYETGREIYTEIFEKAKELAPNNINYLNDYVTLSNGGSSLPIVNNYKQFVQEIKDSGAKLDGIGFQAHIGTTPTSIYKVESVLNEFDDLFDVDMKVTEYDININVSPETQAAYLTDFLTMIFSHEKMNGFLMWGFWDGNHWLDNAPMFDIDWNLKPSGEAFNNLVFDEWWTDVEGSTNQQGEVSLNVFKGQHEIVVEIDGVVVAVQDYEIIEDDVLEITTGPVSTKDLPFEKIKIIPNPNDGSFIIDQHNFEKQSKLEIFNSLGQLVYKEDNLQGKELNCDLTQGLYTIIIKGETTNYIATFMVQ